MLRAISQASSRIHWARACNQTHAMRCDYAFIRDTVAQASFVITAKAVRDRVSRRTPTRVHSIRAPACFWGSSARLEYLRIRGRAACGGLQRPKVHARCIRDSLFSPPASPPRPRATPLGSNRRRSCASRKTSGTSTAIIVAIRPERAGDDFFRRRMGCTVARPHRRGFSPGK